jgi:hypothetical protein
MGRGRDDCHMALHPSNLTLRQDVAGALVRYRTGLGFVCDDFHHPGLLWARCLCWVSGDLGKESGLWSSRPGPQDDQSVGTEDEVGERQARP